VSAVGGARTVARRSLEPRPPRIRICLSMIVRDEERVLLRCLASALPLVDALCLSDTGSSDTTVALAEGWMAREGIPGRVHHDRFDGFGRARTRALRAAQALVRDLGWETDACYLLFLDADQVLTVDPGFRREDLLAADVVYLEQHNSGLTYPSVRLLRASVAGRFAGATHECFVAPPETIQSRLPGLVVVDRNDGGSRAEKLPRDRRLLESALRRDPTDARAMFYLAQTMRDLGDWPKALFWYRRRIAAGGGIQEVWYAHYAIGLLFLEADQLGDAVHWLRLAVRLDPTRPEPYFHLARALRSRGKPLLATLMARAGQAVGPAAEGSLFAEKEVALGLSRELALAAWMTRYRAEGCAANERLALGSGVPRDLSALAVSNLVFYATPLEVHRFVELSPQLPRHHYPCNPSIAPAGDGYLVNCRAVTYRLDEAQRYEPTHPDGLLRTTNHLLRLDRSLLMRAQTTVQCRVEAVRSSRVRGLEDCRLVPRDDGWALVGTTVDLHPNARSGMSLLLLGADLEPRSYLPLTGHGDDLPQKNWLPFAAPAKGLRVVYGYAPFTLLEVDETSGRCRPVLQREEPRPFEHFRGSAGPVALPRQAGGGHLLVIHQVAFHGRRYYLHRFVATDDDWRITRVSRPFYLHHLGVEFVGGCCLSHDGTELLLTFGVDDAEAWLARVPLRDVNDLLLPLPD
jgi:hypothetical protein